MRLSKLSFALILGIATLASCSTEATSPSPTPGRTNIVTFQQDGVQKQLPIYAFIPAVDTLINELHVVDTAAGTNLALFLDLYNNPLTAGDYVLGFSGAKPFRSYFSIKKDGEWYSAKSGIARVTAATAAKLEGTFEFVTVNYDTGDTIRISKGTFSKTF